jgi:aarF domain-containing kinase
MALHKSFALPPDQLFDWIEEVPIACGSIGQVHRAQLSEKGAALACVDPGEVVAVKVCCGCCLCVAQLMSLIEGCCFGV